MGNGSSTASAAPGLKVSRLILRRFVENVIKILMNISTFFRVSKFVMILKILFLDESALRRCLNYGYYSIFSDIEFLVENFSRYFCRKQLKKKFSLESLRNKFRKEMSAQN